MNFYLKENVNEVFFIKDLVSLLKKAKRQIESGNDDEAVILLNTFSSYWLDIEGVVLTKSKTCM